MTWMTSAVETSGSKSIQIWRLTKFEAGNNNESGKVTEVVLIFFSMGVFRTSQIVQENSTYMQTTHFFTE